MPPIDQGPRFYIEEDVGSERAVSLNIFSVLNRVFVLTEYRSDRENSGVHGWTFLRTKHPISIYAYSNDQS